MTKYTKSLFTFIDSWPWVLILLLVLAATGQALHYGLEHGIDKTGFAVLGIVDATFLFIIGLRYILRGVWVENWNNAYQTDVGMAVMPVSGVKLNVSYSDINNALIDAINFWDAKALAGEPYLPPTTKTKVANDYLGHAFIGGTMTIDNKPIVAGSQSFYIKALGLTSGNNIAIDNEKGVETTLNLIRHEASHVCLSALGIDPGTYGTAHHTIFAEAGLGA